MTDAIAVTADVLRKLIEDADHDAVDDITTYRRALATHRAAALRELLSSRAQLAALQREHAGSAQDAARYRWLRVYLPAAIPESIRAKAFDAWRGSDLGMMDCIDAAIDAAMGAREGE